MVSPTPGQFITLQVSHSGRPFNMGATSDAGDHGLGGQCPLLPTSQWHQGESSPGSAACLSSGAFR